MDVEFDPAKDAINRDKHGVSLAFGARLFEDPDLVIADAARPIDREWRHKAIGFVEGRLWTAVYVKRGSAIRFISVRRSNDTESGGYHRYPR